MIYAQASEIEEWKARELEHEDTLTELTECYDANEDLEARIRELEAQKSDLENARAARILELEGTVSELKNIEREWENTVDSLEAFGQEGAVVMTAEDYVELTQAIFVAGATVCMSTENYWLFGV